MVLAGQVKREVVGLINQHGPFAVGMSGEDAHLFTADASTPSSTASTVDIGRVGDIVEVEPGPCGRCSTTAGSRSSPRSPAATTAHVYNVNADTAAAALAAALRRREADRPHRRRGPLRATGADTTET